MIELQRQPRTDARKKFRGFKSERSKAARQCLVEENKAVRQMINIYEAMGDPGSWVSYNDGIKDVARRVADMNYELADLEKFNSILQVFQEQEWFELKAGLLLSALINHCPAKEITIHTDHLSRLINNFGFENTKKVTVEGSLGTNTGEAMQRGEIAVHGHVSRHLGTAMEGGKIEVFGYADDYVGVRMQGGRIIVHKDARDRIGTGMEGGMIVVHGDARDVGVSMLGGVIHVNGACEISSSHPPVHGKIIQRGVVRFEG